MPLRGEERSRIFLISAPFLPDTVERIGLAPPQSESADYSVFRLDRHAYCFFFCLLLERCPPINTKLPELAHHILRYLREHPEAQDTVEGITVWWVSERAIKHWLPQVRSSLATLVAQGYLAKQKMGDGQVFYHVNPARRTRRESPPK
jgi:hypothetical protein